MARVIISTGFSPKHRNGDNIHQLHASQLQSDCNHWVSFCQIWLLKRLQCHGTLGHTGLPL